MSAQIDPHATLPGKLRFWVGQRPNAIALRQKDFGIWEPVSWSDYERHARHFALGLEALGLPEKGHIAIISENRKEWVFAQLGAGMLGAVTVGIYPTSPAAEIEYLLQESDASVVVCEDQEQLDKVLEVRERLPLLRNLVVMDPRGLRRYTVDILTTFEAVTQTGAAYEDGHPALIGERLARQTEDDIALVIFTSGSTGRPKAAMISYGNGNAMTIGTDTIYRCTPADSTVSYLPLCHVAEQIYSVYLPLQAGAVVNFAESLRTIQADLREIAEHVTIDYLGDTILTGTRCPTTRLWYVDLHDPHSCLVPAAPADAQPLPFHSYNAVNPHATIAGHVKRRGCCWERGHVKRRDGIVCSYC